MWKDIVEDEPTGEDPGGGGGGGAAGALGAVGRKLSV